MATNDSTRLALYDPHTGLPTLNNPDREIARHLGCGEAANITRLAPQPAGAMGIGNPKNGVRSNDTTALDNDANAARRARLPIGLVSDIFRALERHGHRLPGGRSFGAPPAPEDDADDRNAAIGRSVGVLATLVDSYTGVQP